MDHFNSLSLPDTLLHALKAMQFHTPTPIQAKTIPSALEGHDILGSAQTGTGKTAAFSIPLVAYLLSNLTKTALVLTPTRELAVQVLETLKNLMGKKSSLRASLLIGGDSMFKQLTQLKQGPRLIVGTPGRVNDHLERGTLKLDQTGFLVLDEMDRMLDMGFLVQLEKIINFIPKEHQTLMFSATMSPHVIKVAEKYLNKAIRISVGSTTSPTEKVKQEIVRTSENEKYGVLLDQLNQHPGSIIVFVKTKFGTEKLATRLRHEGHKADAIHGDLRQRSRDQVIRSFRSQKNRILVATDVAARGLDIPHLECVINYDLPQCPEDYIHRIGRTGRAGSDGIAVSLITSQDNLKWKNICRLLNPGLKPEKEERAPRSFRGKPSAKPWEKRSGSSSSVSRSEGAPANRSSSAGAGKNYRPRVENKWAKRPRPAQDLRKSH